MSGNERSRFCEQCGHHVRNLSLMSAVERAELKQRAQTERICGTYYVRLSGEMVTPDAPLTRSEWSRVKQFGVAALSAGAMALAAGCVSTPAKQTSVSPSALQAVVEQSSAPADEPPAAVAEKKSEKEEEVIQLTGFIVEATEDTGYQAKNTLAGTRLKTRK